MIDEDRHVELGGPRRGQEESNSESEQKGEDSAKMQVSHKVPSSLSVLEFGRDYNLLLLIWQREWEELS